jgi:hypothetical protein
MVEMVEIRQVMWFIMLKSAKTPHDNRCRHMSGMERLAY